MKSITNLQQDRSHKQRCAQDLLDRAEKENRPINVEEQNLFDKCHDEIKGITGEIDAIQAHLDRVAKNATLADDLNKSVRVSQPEKPATATAKRDRVPATYRRCGSLVAFKGTDPDGTTADERAHRCGMWARATLFNDQRAALWCESHFPEFRAALGGTDNSKGGFLFPDDFARSIIDLREQYGVFRRECRVWPMKGDTLLIPRRTGGVTLYFIGENPSSAISQSTPLWNQVQLTAKKAGGLVLMSTEIADDAAGTIMLADYVASEFAYAFAKLEDDCGFIGDGTSTYGGITGLNSILIAGQSLISAVDATSPHDTFVEVDAADLSRCMSALPAYARPNAKWYCSSVCMDSVFGRLMAAGGGNTIMTLETGYQPRYLGYPIVIAQSITQSTSTINDVPMLYFGDLRLAASLGDRQDVRVFPSEHRYMDTDQIGIRGTQRFDIVINDYGDTSVAGPIVALVGNT